jgi:hypothetical protein
MPAPPKEQKLPPMPGANAVPTPPPPVVLPPPPAVVSQDAGQAAQDAQQAAARKKGLRATLLGGDTGGPGGTNTATGSNSLLG